MSRIFISFEAHASVAGIIHDAIKAFESKTGELETANYTDSIDSIGIIINCFDKYWQSKGFGKPRKYISYKNRYADIRLNIPAEELLAADKETRFIMVKNNIIESIKIINERLNKKTAVPLTAADYLLIIDEKTAEI